MEEIWKEVKYFEDYYEVSNMGRVRSIDRYVEHKRHGVVLRKGNILKQYTDSGGYKYVNLHKDGKRKIYLVHRLVADAFIPNPNNYPCVNHKDENKTNNRVDNLEFCTQKYNTNYGTCIQRRAEKKSKPVLQYTKDGKFVNEYPSMIEAERHTGIFSVHISKCCNNKPHHRSAGGFIWKFKD